MQLNTRQKEVLAGKFADLGNIALGSLVFGYVLKSEALNELSLLIGLSVALVAYAITVSLQK